MAFWHLHEPENPLPLLTVLGWSAGFFAMVCGFVVICFEKMNICKFDFMAVWNKLIGFWGPPGPNSDFAQLRLRFWESNKSRLSRLKNDILRIGD